MTAVADLTLCIDEDWMSPWVFHALVALEEKRLPYDLEPVTFPLSPGRRAELQRRAVIGKVPLLRHGALWISESLAISEYLAEAFPFPAHPRLFPADLAERARARQVLSFLRTDLFALREDRPTTTIFSEPVTAPLSPRGRIAADELLRVADRLIGSRRTLFGEWCIADADLALALMRLIKSGDPVPESLVAYADAQWQRPSVKAFVDKPRA